MNTEEGVVDSPQTDTISDTSTEDLRDMMATQPEAQEAPVTESEAEAQTEEPVAQEGVEETSEELSVEADEETEEERLAKRRIRPRNELDQQVIDLYRSDGFSGTMSDATRVIYGQQETAPPPTQEAIEALSPDPFEGYYAESDRLGQEIATLEAQVEEAADNLDTSEALKFQREITRREIQLETLKNRQEMAQERQNEQAHTYHQNKAVESRDLAYQSYPELTDTTGVYRKEFDDYVAQAQKDADFASVFQSPRWPEIIAHDFAAKKGHARSTSAQVNPAPGQHAPAMGTQAKTLTTGNTSRPTTVPKSPQEFINGMATATNEDLYAILGQPDGRRPLR
jgi:hypothetical protein